MNRFLKSILMLLGLFLLVSCGGGSKEAEKTESAKSDSGEGKAEVAIILKTLSNPFWVSMKEGIEKEAAVAIVLNFVKSFLGKYERGY